jgi:hypothetical protein
MRCSAGASYCVSRFLLDLDGTTLAVNAAAKLDQYSSAGALNDAAAMRRDRRFQEFAAMRIEADQRTLIPSAGYTDNICCKDAGKAPLNALFCHSEQLLYAASVGSRLSGSIAGLQGRSAA